MRTVFLFVLFLSVSISLGQVNWTKDTENNPIFVPGAPGTWNDVS